MLYPEGISFFRILLLSHIFLGVLSCYYILDKILRNESNILSILFLVFFNVLLPFYY